MIPKYNAIRLRQVMILNQDNLSSVNKYKYIISYIVVSPTYYIDIYIYSLKKDFTVLCSFLLLLSYQLLVF